MSTWNRRRKRYDAHRDKNHREHCTSARRRHASCILSRSGVRAVPLLRRGNVESWLVHRSKSEYELFARSSLATSWIRLGGTGRLVRVAIAAALTRRCSDLALAVTWASMSSSLVGR